MVPTPSVGVVHALPDRVRRVNALFATCSFLLEFFHAIHALPDRVGGVDALAGHGQVALGKEALDGLLHEFRNLQQRSKQRQNL